MDANGKASSTVAPSKVALTTQSCSKNFIDGIHVFDSMSSTWALDRTGPFAPRTLTMMARVLDAPHSQSRLLNSLRASRIVFAAATRCLLGKDANRDITLAPPLKVGNAGGHQGCRSLASAKFLGLSSGFSNTLAQNVSDDSWDFRSITSSKPCVPWPPKLTAPRRTSPWRGLQ